jgi:deoxyguanosine kinase
MTMKADKRMLDRFQFIAVEGAIGSGKTQLAQLLSERMDAYLMLELAQANLFLDDFYSDMSRYALATQLSFLLHRRTQWADLPKLRDRHNHLVSDWLFDKDRVYAELILQDREMNIYQRIHDQFVYHNFTQRPFVPDLVIYLQASPQRLMHEVRERNRPIEQDIGEDYVAQLCQQYDRFFYDYNAAPIMMINTDHINPAQNPEDFEWLLTQIQTMKGRREYFNRLV